MCSRGGGVGGLSTEKSRGTVDESDERLGRLGAAERERPCEVRRDALRGERAVRGLLGADGVSTARTVEKGGSVGRVEPDLACDLGERGAVADVATVEEEGREERLGERLLVARLPGKPEQAVGVERVGRALDGREVEVEAA